MGDETVTADERRDRDRRDRFDRFIRRIYVIMVLVLVVSFVSAGLNVYLLGQNSQRSNDAVRLAKRIQQSRADAIRAGCKETNSRNAVAYAYLKGLPRQPNQPKLSPDERERLLRGFTDALVGPVRDCETRVRQLAH